MKTILLSLLFIISSVGFAQTIKVDSITSNKFGKIKLYVPSQPKEIVLFISGDAGWKYGVIDMAKALARKGALVAGINILHYWKFVQNSKSPCVYLSGDFEDLSKYLQNKYHFNSYHLPVLAGYSSGATLVYALLAQSPDETYKGGIALGFCPDYRSKKKICVGSGLHSVPLGKPNTFNFLPRKNLKTPFFVLEGDLDKVCNPKATQKFMLEITNGKDNNLAHVGHGFSVQRNWMPQYLDAYNHIINSFNSALKVRTISSVNFPVNEIESPYSSDKPLIISISGDGGWKGFISGLSMDLSKDSLPSVGLDALSYFWQSKTPDQTTKDIVNLVNYYLNKWHRKSFILLGYSFGANIIPFVVNRFPQELKNKMDMMVLLSPDEYADFQFHFGSWFDLSSSKALPVLPELSKLQASNALFIFGNEEEHTIIPELPKKFKIELVNGDHHYNYQHYLISRIILKKWNEEQHK